MEQVRAFVLFIFKFISSIYFFVSPTTITFICTNTSFSPTCLFNTSWASKRCVHSRPIYRPQLLPRGCRHSFSFVVRVYLLMSYYCYKRIIWLRKMLELLPLHCRICRRPFGCFAARGKSAKYGRITCKLFYVRYIKGDVCQGMERRGKRGRSGTENGEGWGLIKTTGNRMVRCIET